MADRTYTDEDEPTPYARIRISPDQATAAAEAAMRKAMAEKSGGRR